MNIFSLLNKKIQKLLKENKITEPTEIQKISIPEILNKKNVLLIAPTGMGKTEAVILPVFDCLLKNKPNPTTLDFNMKCDGKAQSTFPSILGIYRENSVISLPKTLWLQSLQTPVSVLYITPLRALNRDMLKRTIDFGKKLGINVMVRHGDTSRKERVYQSKNPPDLLITTPETLQILLLGKRLRQHLSHVKWVIVDEIHELSPSERGAQLSIALERLAELAGDFQRIGLSATVGSPEKIGKFLVGAKRTIKILKVSDAKKLEIHVETPKTKKINKEIASQISSTLKTASCILRCREIIKKHNSTLFFVNTRDTAEALASRIMLTDKKFPLAVHHGSLSKNVRVKAEDDFKNGKIKSLICTSSLELGIDVGITDFVLHYNSPRQVVRLVQRIGRSGHRTGETSKGKIIATDPDDIAESVVIAGKALNNELEEIKIRENPLGVLANQIVGFAMKGKRDIDETIKIIRRAYPFRNLDKFTFMSVLSQLKDEGIIWSDNIFFGKRKNAIDYFYENISMIPDEKKYRVMNVISQSFVGILDERFVANYINIDATFIMKGLSWTVVEIKNDTINVEQIQGIGEVPSWIGEELPVPFDVAVEVGRLRRNILDKKYPADQETIKIFYDYIKKQKTVPNDKLVTIESNNKIIIINACFGSTVNETIARILSSLIAAKTGSSVRVQSDPYRIILETPIRVKSEIIKKYLLETKPESIESILKIVLKNSSYLKYQLLHTAKKFGLIRKNADYSLFGLSKLMELLKDTVIYDEAVNRIIHEKMDIESTKKVLELIQNKNINMKITGITPIGLAGIEKRKELIGPELVDREILLMLKKRLGNQHTILLCLSCKRYRRIRIKNIENTQCPICNSVLVASVNEKTVQDFERKKISEFKIKKLRKNANLVLSYNKKALLCLAGRGIGVDTASRILGKRHETEEEFLRDILGAEINYARTKRFW